jgi:pyruvate dehydrogenase E1 component alpha subunit
LTGRSFITRKKLKFEGELTWLQILDETGKLDPKLEPEIPEPDLVRLYRTMLLVREFDETRLRLQRQGRIGTFAPVKGQEAAQLGSIYALELRDWFVPSFRETAAAVWRGLKLEDDLLYVAGWEEGIDLPHDSHDLPICITVGSQPTHAAGIAWGAKLRGDDAVALTYFGDGATSEGDIHEALNWAKVYDLGVIFLCQNNQFAISTPRASQTHSTTIAQKALAYGMPGVQVDGNDILAVYAATREAVARGRAGDGPTFIEAVTYRMSVHTTADDPKRYRKDDEVVVWEKRDPLLRFHRYLLEKGIISDRDRETWSEEVKGEVKEAVARFERKLEELVRRDIFAFAYAGAHPVLERQRVEFEGGIEITPEGEVRGRRSDG